MSVNNQLNPFLNQSSDLYQKKFGSRPVTPYAATPQASAQFGPDSAKALASYAAMTPVAPTYEANQAVYSKNFAGETIAGGTRLNLRG